MQYREAIDGHLPYSSFNYLSLRCYWPEAQVCLLPDGVALVLDTPPEHQPFLTVLGRNPDLRALIDLSSQLQLDAALRLVPECSLPSPAERLDIQERRDGHDYLIALDAMLNPEAPGMVAKHRLAADCLASNKGLILEEASLARSDIRELVSEIEQAWQSARNGNRNDNGTLNWEREAFRRCLLLAEAGVVEPLALVARRANGEPLGFTINEPLPDGYYMAHFGKTLPGHPGLAELLEMETASRMLQRGCHTMNFQEDHGNPGLRRMKQSWNPCKMLRVCDVQVV
jgi:hypothetical protein